MEVQNWLIYHKTVVKKFPYLVRFCSKSVDIFKNVDIKSRIFEVFSHVWSEERKRADANNDKI